MRSIAKSLVRNEKGQAMVMILFLILVGGLIVASLLSYVGTGLLNGRVYERRTAELYAADAGVEDAVWKIQHPVEAGYLPCSPGNPPRVYTITDINGRDVEVTIEYVDGGTYRITSIAVADDGGGTAAIDSSSQIEAYVTGASVSDDYSGILDGILTSQGVLDWGSKLVLNYTEGHEAEANYAGAWPDDPEEVDRFAQFYWMDVRYGTELGSGTVDLAGLDMDLGPAYRDGELEITNSINDPATLTLGGTLYTTGHTEIGTNGHPFTLDLNGHTIFVASDITGSPYALWVGGKCLIKGPGCIIALGDVYFEPNPDVGGVGEPVFVFSVLGATTIRPGVNMYGAVAGSVEVDIQTGSKPQINYPEGGFGGLINFPGFVETKLVYSIASWKVTPLPPG
jgi:hypothetical protein